MNKLYPCGRSLAFVVLVSLFAVTAHAQATRTWVSGVGDDVNPCSRTAPCKTFAGAISKTFINGEINCLDPGGFGTLTITKSITIDCHEIFASVLASGTTAFNISFDSFQTNGNDPLKTVRLRNLNISGSGSSGTVGTRTGINGIRITGGTVVAGGSVFIEDVLIDGFSNRGISDERHGGGELDITNTTVRNCGATGIVALPASGTARIDVTMEHVRANNNNYGIAMSSGVRATVNNSVFSQNVNAGIYADVNNGGLSQLNVNSSVTSSNAIGIQSVGGGTTITISNVDISNNVTGVFGSVMSFGTNRLAGNAGAGTPLTPIGSDSHAKGQQ
jgi:hypothetical protein